MTNEELESIVVALIKIVLFQAQERYALESALAGSGIVSGIALQASLQNRIDHIRPVLHAVDGDSPKEILIKLSPLYPK